MKNIIIFISIVLLLVSFVSCGDSEYEKARIEREHISDSSLKAKTNEIISDSLKKLKTRNDIINLSNKHNAQMFFDSIDVEFSIDCDTLKFDFHNPVLIKEVFIVDIFRKDKSFYLIISFFAHDLKYYNPLMLFTLECTEEQKNKIYSSEKTTFKNRNNYAFIITLDSLKKVNFKIISEVDGDRNEGTYLDIDFNSVYKGYGALIDFIEY